MIDIILNNLVKKQNLFSLIQKDGPDNALFYIYLSTKICIILNYLTYGWFVDHNYFFKLAIIALRVQLMLKLLIISKHDCGPIGGFFLFLTIWLYRNI